MFLPRPFRTALAAAIALAAIAVPLPRALAEDARGPTLPVAEIAVLPGWRTASGSHMAALRVTLAPGWKTYWRAPGDGGIPPRFDWTGSKNLAEVRFHWPRPDVFELGGLRAIGYSGELVLPIELVPARAGEPIRMRAEVEIGICEEVCVPMSARLAADLDSPGGSDPRIARALSERPATAGEAGVAGVACEVAPISDGLRLTARIDMPALGGEEVTVFELPDPGVWVSSSQGRRDGGRLVAASDLVPSSGAPFALDRSEIRITVLGRGRAVELQGCPAG